MKSILMDARSIAGLTRAQMSRLVHQIGSTPIKPIYLVIEGKVRKVDLKLEGANPTGSVKDRTGYALIED